MTDKVTYLTKEGLEKLQSELDELIRVRRKEIAARIQEAKELGDLSENAEYQEAKNEQAFNEGRIEEIENTLKHAELINEEKRPTGVVQVGSTIVVQVNGSESELTIVGSNEADPMAGKISNESPIGQALIGKRIQETVAVKTPSGERQYTITAVK